MKVWVGRDGDCIMAVAWDDAYNAAEIDEFRAAWERRGFTVACIDPPGPWFWHTPGCKHDKPAEVTR